MNLPCLTCGHLTGDRTPIRTMEKDNIYLIPCQFFLPPVYQNEDEDCIGWVKREEEI